MGIMFLHKVLVLAQAEKSDIPQQLLLLTTPGLKTKDISSVLAVVCSG